MLIVTGPLTEQREVLYGIVKSVQCMTNKRPCLGPSVGKHFHWDMLGI